MESGASVALLVEGLTRSGPVADPLSTVHADNEFRHSASTRAALPSASGRGARPGRGGFPSLEERNGEIVGSISIGNDSGRADTVSGPGAGPGGRPSGGPGKELVEGVCTGCHQTNQITRSSGYTREGWKELTGTMIDLSGSPEERDQIIDYLATHFPPNNKRAPKLMPGDAQIAFKEWQVPTLGQRSRDPVEAAGRLHLVGRAVGQPGRADRSRDRRDEGIPAAGERHAAHRDARCRGQRLVHGQQERHARQARPEHRRDHRLQDARPRRRRTRTRRSSTRRGSCWFTLQHSNMVGRLDPATGDIKLVTMKTPDAKPYGIKIDADGVPWVACNGSNCLVKVDPATMELTEIKLPTPGTTVRRLDIADDGMIWYVNSSQGPARPLRPEDRRDQGVALAQRAGVPSLRHRGRRRHRLVQRVGQAAGCAGPLRSEHGDVPELADPVGRRLCRHHPAHAADARRQPADPPEQHQPHHPGDAERPHAGALACPRRTELSRARAA